MAKPENDRELSLPELPRPACTFADHRYPAFSERQMRQYAVDAILARQTGEPVAWPNDKPPPHWTPDDHFDRHPKTAEAWDWRQDGPAGDERHDRMIRRLNFAGDMADPRAPDQMALVLRKDLIDIKHKLLRQTALAGLYKRQETATAEAQAQVEALEAAARSLVGHFPEGRRFPELDAMRALLSGSTPKPARVEITEEVLEALRIGWGHARAAIERAENRSLFAVADRAKADADKIHSALTAALSPTAPANAGSEAP